MNRRDFIKKSITASILVAATPHLASQDDVTNLPYKELIGKGNPELFGNGYQLRLEAHLAFEQLKKAALKSDINIQVVSSYRGYDHQNRIWTRKYNRFINKGLTPEQSIKNIIAYSTIPGTSRHHWGTDLDIIDANVSQPNSVLQPRHFEEGGCFRALKLWMDDHAASFGFHLVYTNDADRKGFKYEPWHYSYKPLSKVYLKDYLKLNIPDIIASENLLGHSHFSKSFIKTYLDQNILDINPELL